MSQEEKTGTRLDGIRVLVVEDDPDAADLLGEILKEVGAVVEKVLSAQQALSKAVAFRPHVLVSDITLPGVDGYELVRRLRVHADAEARRIPAVAVTAHARGQDAMQALSAGFQAHVAKPIEADEFIVLVASLVNRSQ